MNHPTDYLHKSVPLSTSRLSPLSLSSSHLPLSRSFSVRRMPPTLTYELASLAEPLSVVIQATRRSNGPQPGSSVLVLGCGAVGLLSCAVARAMGATRIVAVDIDQSKLEFAKSAGWADQVVVLPRGKRVSGFESLDAAKELKVTLEKQLGTDGFDTVFECSGVEVSGDSQFKEGRKRGAGKLTFDASSLVVPFSLLSSPACRSESS